MALMKLVGAPVKRVEDPRFLRGQAQYRLSQASKSS
jgi:hypothetical protein